MRGFPIRTPSDQRSVGSSPRLIAASHVLHRLLVPRHPPCALNNLTTQKIPPTHARKDMNWAGLHQLLLQSQKMLASTVQFSTYDQPPVTRPHQPRPTHEWRRRYEMQTGPEQKQRFPAPSGPNSVPTTTTPAPPRSPHRTRTPRRRHAHDAVLGAAPGCRPNWSAFHPRAPPHTLREHPRLDARPGAGAALDHHNQCGGQCSLERR